MLLENNFFRKFRGWKMQLLSHSGRLVLIKSVLASISVYYMSTTILSTKITRELTSLIRKFFWGKMKRDQFSVMISWDKMCIPIEDGGLNIRDLKKMNEALLMKLT
jgi:hypothetical protein